MRGRVALVTDSTSADAVLAERLNLVVVPLQVIVDDQAFDEGSGITPDEVAAALRDKRSVSTSRPAPDGGTLDKLESIPGWRADVSYDAMLEQLEQVGAVVCAAGSTLAPADKKLYALRDVTLAPLVAACG